ncbi:MAG: hypothetical protein ACRC1M_05795 [Methanobacteriaceae archaeon]
MSQSVTIIIRDVDNMPPKSKVEKSKHYNEILDMIKEGLSSRHISDYLKNQYGEVIGYRSISRYIEKLKSETSTEYYKAKKKKSKAKTKKISEVVDSEVAKKIVEDEFIAKGVNDLSSLDNIIEEASKINLNVNNLRVEYSERGKVVTSEADIEKIIIQVKKLAIEAIKAKKLILKDEVEAPAVNVNFVTSDEVITLLKKDTK